MFGQVVKNSPTLLRLNVH